MKNENEKSELAESPTAFAEELQRGGQSTVLSPQSGDGADEEHPISNNHPPATDAGVTGDPETGAAAKESGEHPTSNGSPKPPAEGQSGWRQAGSAVLRPQSGGCEVDPRLSTDWLIRKVRENSTWSKLLPAERYRLDGWLFEENLGYAKIVARVQKEFGIKTTIASVSRYYRRRARERQAEELVEAQLTAEGLNGLGVDANTLRVAVLKLVGKAALIVAAEKPEEFAQLASLAELLLKAEYNDLRRGQLELAERQFNFDATLATVDEMPQVRAFLESVSNNKSLSEDEKIKRVHEMLFRWAEAAKRPEKPDNER